MEEIAAEKGWVQGPLGSQTSSDLGYYRDDLEAILSFRDKKGNPQEVRIRGGLKKIVESCKTRPVIPGEAVFDLYTTYGFPVDLTELMAKELGLSVDKAGYEKAMAEHREVSAGQGDKFRVEAAQNLPATDAKGKYSLAPIKARVLGWVVGTEFVAQGELAAGEESAVVLDKTNFYGEQGGQVGDCGKLSYEGGEFVVRTAQLAGECVLHLGQATGAPLRVGAQVTARVDAAVRRDTMRNHTATHLLNWALRKVLGEHVAQAGSVVAPDRLRFDFTHNQAATPEQLAEVERLVNQRVLDDVPVVAGMMPLAQAKQIPGVQAVFGEKYPDPVRVIVTGSGEEGGAGERSAEFCGGTHLERTGQVGPFKIVSEESVAKGVRRLTALSGMAAVRHIQETDAAVRQAAALLRVSPADVPARIEAMQKELKALRKAKAGGAGEGAATWTAIEAPGGRVVIGQMDGADAPALRTACDVQRQKGAAAVFVGAVTGEKVTLVAMVSEELARSGKLSAGEWVKAVAPAVGGSGGGKPTLAQAGGREAAKLPDALRQAADWAKARLA
jgi:alanyl-tRNA synthetase